MLGVFCSAIGACKCAQSDSGTAARPTMCSKTSCGRSPRDSPPASPSSSVSSFALRAKSAAAHCMNVLDAFLKATGKSGCVSGVQATGHRNLKTPSGGTDEDEVVWRRTRREARGAPVDQPGRPGQWRWHRVRRDDAESGDVFPTDPRSNRLHEIPLILVRLLEVVPDP